MKIPTKKVKQRDIKLLEYCVWKKVLHIWASDSPYTKEKFNGLMWDFLYRKIDEVCSDQLWVDLDEESVNFLNAQKDSFPRSRSICLDMNQFWDLDYQPDVIIFGEVIEHLMNLETALTNLKKVMNKDTLLIISTPNAYCFEWIIWNFFWRESFHHDHKIYFTHWMLRNLLEYNNFEVVDTYFCDISHQSETLKRRILKFIWNYIVYYFFPRFYYTLLFIVKVKA